MKDEPTQQLTVRDGGSWIVSKSRSEIIARGRRDAATLGAPDAGSQYELALEEPAFLDPLSEVRRLAEGGSADAQYALGGAYLNGEGVPKDDEKSHHWYFKAAIQGHKDAQFMIAGNYDSGIGASEDHFEAERWFRKCVDQYRKEAERGDASAQVWLGEHLMVRGGACIDPFGDDVEAVYWSRKAADQGSPEGQHLLGYFYYIGKGVSQDYAEAARWYRLAAEQGWGGAQVDLAEMYRDGKGVPQDYAEAARWYRLAAEQGWSDAQVELAEMYRDGKGVSQDYAEAARWYQLAAEQDDDCSLRSRLLELGKILSSLLPTPIHHQTPLKHP